MCYLDLGYGPDPERNLIATYALPPESKAGARATPWSWSKADALRRVPEEFAARAFHVDEGSGIFDIAYPVELFEPGNVAQWLSVFAGALFGPVMPDAVGLLDIRIPEDMNAPFRGPKFGIEGVRRIVGTDGDGRPHLGMAFGKLGMTAEEMSALAYEVGGGGVSLLLDNGALTDQAFCRLPARIVNVMEALDRVREEGGRRVLYAVNVTADSAKVLDRADTAIENGANCLMVDVFGAGLSSLSKLSEDASLPVPIHAHVAPRPHGALANVTSTLVLTKLMRLLGGDQIEMAIRGPALSALSELKSCKAGMLEEWRGIKRAFPAVIEGIHPGVAHSLIGELGRDIVLIAVEGVCGHPKGSRAGAIALNQAMDAIMAGVSAEIYARDHEELRVAIERWGIGDARI